MGKLKILTFAMLGILAISGLSLNILRPAQGGSSSADAQELCILVSGQSRGQIKLCKCPGGLVGGLPRRATFVDLIRRSGADSILIDVGALMRRSQRRAKENAMGVFAGMKAIRYDAVFLAEEDLAFGPEFLQENLVDAGIPVVCANLVHRESGEPVFQPTISFKTRDYGIVSMLGVVAPRTRLVGRAEPVEKFDLTVADHMQTIRELLPGMLDKGDKVILVGDLRRDEISEIVQEYPELDAVITPVRQVARGSSAASRSPVPVLAPRAVGNFFKNAGVLEYSVPDHEEHPAVRIVKLDQDTYPESPELAQLLAEYAKSTFHATARKMADEGPVLSYVGAQQCASCHGQEHDIWQRSDHAGALDRLVESGDFEQQECLPCHVVGFGVPSGYQSAADAPVLGNVQCENCHGKASLHVEEPSAPYGGAYDWSRMCSVCHSEENDPAFNFASYWERVKH